MAFLLAILMLLFMMLMLWLAKNEEYDLPSVALYYSIFQETNTILNNAKRRRQAQRRLHVDARYIYQLHQEAYAGRQRMDTISDAYLHRVQELTRR